MAYTLSILIRLKFLEHSIGWGPIASTAWTSYYALCLWPDEVIPRSQYWECYGNVITLPQMTSAAEHCWGNHYPLPASLRVGAPNCESERRAVVWTVGCVSLMISLQYLMCGRLGSSEPVRKHQKTMQVIGMDSCAICSTRDNFQEWEERIWLRKLINWC